jgi:hypothetical protein
VPPVPIDPIELELPDTNPPPMVEPMHGVAVTLGAGTPINELTPPLSISVAPSGIAPPPRFDVTLAPDSGEAVPIDETTLDDGIEQLFAVAAEAMPPPSNDDVVPVVPIVAPAAIPLEEPAIPVEEEVVPTQLELLDIGPIGVGPMPPGSISVAPRGIPVGEPEEVDPGIPSGDVSPIPGVVAKLCVNPAPELQRSTTAAMNNRRIKTSSGQPLSAEPLMQSSVAALQVRQCQTGRLFEIAAGSTCLRGYLRGRSCEITATAN